MLSFIGRINHCPSLLIGLAILVVAVSCVNPIDDDTADRGFSAGLTGTSVPIPTVDLDVDPARNDAINEAIRAATVGCPGVPDALSGGPTRILMAVTRFVLAEGFVNPEANFEYFGTPAPGGGGSGAVSVWVVAIEGHSITSVGGDASATQSELRSFVFVLAPWDPTVTGCVVRDAPIATRISQSMYGSFDFDVLFDSS